MQQPFRTRFIRAARQLFDRLFYDRFPDSVLQSVSDINALPYKSICSLNICYSSEGCNNPALGTGWFAGPKTIITAGHNLFTEGRRWAEQIDITVPGHGDETIFSLDKSHFKVHPKWQDSTDKNFDYGVIHLEEPLLDAADCFIFKDQANENLMGAKAYISGYLFMNDREHVSQYFASGKILQFDDNWLYYKISTDDGQSGSPVWIQVQSNFIVIGIHVYEPYRATSINRNTGRRGDLNSAVRINEEVAQTLGSWIEIDR